MLIETRDGLAEFGPLQRLLEEVGAAESHRAKQEVLCAVRGGKNDISVRGILPDLFERAEALIDIERDVEKNRSLRARSEIMQDPRREVRAHVCVGTDDLRVRVANEIVKAGFGAGNDELNHGAAAPVSGFTPALCIATVVENGGTCIGEKPSIGRK